MQPSSLFQEQVLTSTRPQVRAIHSLSIAQASADLVGSAPSRWVALCEPVELFTALRGERGGGRQMKVESGRVEQLWALQPRPPSAHRAVVKPDISTYQLLSREIIDLGLKRWITLHQRYFATHIQGVSGVFITE